MTQKGLEFSINATKWWHLFFLSHMTLACHKGAATRSFYIRHGFALSKKTADLSENIEECFFIKPPGNCSKQKIHNKSPLTPLCTVFMLLVDMATANKK